MCCHQPGNVGSAKSHINSVTGGRLAEQKLSIVWIRRLDNKILFNAWSPLLRGGVLPVRYQELCPIFLIPSNSEIIQSEFNLKIDITKYLEVSRIVWRICILFAQAQLNWKIFDWHFMSSLHQFGRQSIKIYNFISSHVTLHPYFISVWEAKSLALLIVSDGVVIVRKAARLAVYEEMMIRVNSHHDIAIILVEGALGMMSHPENRRKIHHDRVFGYSINSNKALLNWTDRIPLLTVINWSI